MSIRPTQLSLSQLGQKFQEIAKTVDKGFYSEKAPNLSNYINDILTDQEGTWRAEGDSKERAIFTTGVERLIGSLGQFSDRAITRTVDKLKSTIAPDELLPSNEIFDEGAVPRKPAAWPRDRKEAVSLFRDFRSQAAPGVEKAFVAWMDYYSVSLSQVDLTKDEVMALAPHFENLDFDLNSWSKEDVAELFNSCENLSSLSFSHQTLESMPALPASTSYVHIRDCFDLKEGPDFHEGLTEIRMTDCSSVRLLDKPFPESLVKLSLSGLDHLRRIPALPAGLERADFSACHELELNDDALPNGLTHLDTSESSGDGKWSKLPKLPSSLKHLKINDMANLSEVKYPPNLETLDVRWTPNLDKSQGFPEGVAVTK